MRRNRTAPRGRVERLELDSEALRGNLQGDPTRRELQVYLPAGRSDGGGLPLLVDLVGFTGSGMSHTNWKNFGENLPERLDRLIGEGQMGPVVVAFPDCFTRLGGNQYINSTALGRYEDYLLQEVVPVVEQTFRCGGEGKRAVFGKSSGGYGAIVHAMRHGGFWSAAACHSGDMAFDLVYGCDLPGTLNDLAKHERSIPAFIEHFEKSQKPSEREVHTLMFLAMAATYDPDPTQPFGIRLPCDPETAELIPERWSNWTAHDPLTMVSNSASSLRRLKGLFIDCGDRDQYHLHYGARRLHHALTRLEIPHVYEEFPDDHSNVDYRMDRSLPYLEQVLR
jgi:S-formylglutathione hydrolase FrmB